MVVVLLLLVVLLLVVVSCSLDSSSFWRCCVVVLLVVACEERADCLAEGVAVGLAERDDGPAGGMMRKSLDSGWRTSEYQQDDEATLASCVPSVVSNERAVW